ncbi:MAG: two-component sensor histidine kinase [Phycisphaerae bacterium]|nr:two-component sensor histidine kinase [Phycisphaerae bacterium]
MIGVVAVGLPWSLRVIQKKRAPCSHGHEHEGLIKLSKLTGELAHEIKNPLSTIKVNLKLIQEDLDGLSDTLAGRASRKIRIVQGEAERLHSILDGFLRFIGRPELHPEVTDLNELISDLVDFFQPEAAANHITSRKALSEEALYCCVDSAMIKQVILNLFVNAQQAMDHGGELIIRTFRQKDWVVLQINDTGCGISPDTQAKIFEPYYSGRRKGTGLGLAIAKKIIDSHNGTISLDSEPGRGTAFTIRFPRCTLGPNSEELKTIE